MELNVCKYQAVCWCLFLLVLFSLHCFVEGKEIEEQIDLPASDGPDDWVPISSTLSPPFSPGDNRPYGFVGRILDFIVDIFGYGPNDSQDDPVQPTIVRRIGNSVDRFINGVLRFIGLRNDRNDNELLREKHDSRSPFYGPK